jgi:prepilin-type N-terminal cleavage/methylation domain-containing protein
MPVRHSVLRAARTARVGNPAERGPTHFSLRRREPAKRARHARRAMTLVEIMVVVSMIGVLAAIAIVSYRRLLMAGKGKEDADSAMQAVSSAVDDFYKKHRGYLDCSTDFNPSNMYPLPPTNKKHPYNNPSHAKYDCWKLYNVKITATYMSFAIRAGTKNDSPPAPPFTIAGAWPNYGRPWYVLVGATDLDGDNTVFGYYVASSFAPGELHRKDEGK